jgi:short-subunit dehydrogenase
MYSPSKFALEALSDILRMELEAFNIKVSVIEPGPVKTEFFTIAGDKVDLNVPESGKTLYRAAIQAIKEIEQQTASLAWSSEQVAGAIIGALTHRNPRPRYVPATGWEDDAVFNEKTPADEAFRLLLEAFLQD